MWAGGRQRGTGGTRRSHEGFKEERHKHDVMSSVRIFLHPSDVIRDIPSFDSTNWAALQTCYNGLEKKQMHVGSQKKGAIQGVSRVKRGDMILICTLDMTC